jgi:hypothetical protein
VYPAAQEKPQTPEEHVGTPFGGAVHAFPQLPQFAASLAVETHEPLQFVLPGSHVMVHTPAEHVCPDGQAVAQVPQCIRSDVRSAHWSLQAENPLLHVTVHCPPTHDAEPFAGAAQALPQAPQFFGSLSSLRHAPEQAE